MSEPKWWKMDEIRWRAIWRGHVGLITHGSLMYRLSVDRVVIGSAPTLNAAKAWFKREVEKKSEPEGTPQ